MPSLLSWLQAQWAAVPAEAGWMLLLALAISSTGFKRVVWFVSIGYAFSIAGMAALALVLFRDHLHVLVVLQVLALGAYGLRLGSFLVARERAPSYQRENQENATRGAGLSLGKKGAIWVGVSALYLFMFSPALFQLDHLRTGGESLVPMGVTGAGVGIMAVGLGLQALADRQKSAYKAANPRRFCDVGLYRFVRCPNYLGEVVFWTGGLLAGLPALTTPSRWLLALVGWICIVLIMMGSTKRLEKTQKERYGQDPAYQAYIRRVPVLFPFVPVYSLENVRVYLE